LILLIAVKGFISTYQQRLISLARSDWRFKTNSLIFVSRDSGNSKAQEKKQRSRFRIFRRYENAIALLYLLKEIPILLLWL